MCKILAKAEGTSDARDDVLGRAQLSRIQSKQEAKKLRLFEKPIVTTHSGVSIMEKMIWLMGAAGVMNLHMVAAQIKEVIISQKGKDLFILIEEKVRRIAYYFRITYSKYGCLVAFDAWLLETKTRDTFA